MPRAQRFPTLPVVVACAMLATPAYAHDRDGDGTLFQVRLPGGVQAALDVLGDHGVAHRSDFLLDVIRRHHHAPRRRPGPPRDRVLDALVAHLDRAAGYVASAREAVPLPLHPDIWLDVILPRGATRDTLVAAILRSRDAALLYHGLLSLDDETRAWLATHPDLIAEIVASSAAQFATAAPGLRVSGGVARMPGGAAAQPAWEALVGQPMDDPVPFVRALLAPARGHLTYFTASMAHLTPPQIALAMGLESPDPADRIAAARRVVLIFDQLGWQWQIADRTFWRPALDPALLAADLAAGDDGRPRLPGTEAFWRLAFADNRRGLSRPTSEADARAAAEGAPVDFVWLCEQIFDGSPTGPQARYHLVLYASRVVGPVTPGRARDAIDAVRAAAAYPSLAGTLERAGVTDIAVLASAGRRAATLSAIRGRATAQRSLAQFQGVLAVLARAASQGTLPKAALTHAVGSLAAIATNDRGDYEGRLVRWLDAHLREGRAGSRRPSLQATAIMTPADTSLDDRLTRALAGPTPTAPAIVDWEGMRYQVDFARAEALRLAQLLGQNARPYASSALAVVAIADSLAAAPDVEAVRRAAADLEAVAEAFVWHGGRPRVVEAVQRRARNGDVRGAARLAADLRLVADDLLGRGLTVLAYAVAMGQPERTPIAAGEAASRHDFELGAGDWRHLSAWQPPVERMDPRAGWRVAGSLLGLDVRLAPFSLLQLSQKPPGRRPTLNDQDRRLLIETVVLLESVFLADADRDVIVAAMQAGRARLMAVRTPSEALAIADRIRLGPARRSLLSWVVAHDPDNVARFLSPGELLWLGVDDAPIAPALHAWGAPGRPRLGCQCLRLVDRRPWESFAGRWNSGIVVSAFPDLNLRLTELLAELQMPAPLLGPVLAPALLDFVNLVVSRDPDDRRGLVDFVDSLRLDQVEQYLAALTTDGPLVPMGETPQHALELQAREREVP